MTRRCGPGSHDVPDHEAEYLGGSEGISGPGTGRWACHQHVRDLGLVPAAASAWIGRQDAAPIRPGRSA